MGRALDQHLERHGEEEEKEGEGREYDYGDKR